MKKWMLLTFLLVMELMLGAMAVSDWIVCRQAASRAFYESRVHPTPENEAKWQAEAAKTRRIAHAIDAIVILLLIINSIFIIRISKNKRGRITGEG